MKKLLLILCLFSGVNYVASAQITDFSIAPDFTFSDINGTSFHLYDYLNQGKVVVIDGSATWCHPCWQYHISGSFDSLYEKHDAPGDNKWKVIFMEVDPSTNSADLHGTTGLPNTQGDWTANSSYTIIDPPSSAAFTSFLNTYGITYYPTFFMIMPNKRVYQHTLNDYQNGVWPPPVYMWEQVYATALGVDNISDKNTLNIYPNPAIGNTNVSFNLNNSSNVKIEVTNTLGQVVGNMDLGRLNAGDHTINYSVQTLTPGMYYFTVATENNNTVTKKLMVQ